MSSPQVSPVASSVPQAQIMLQAREWLIEGAILIAVFTLQFGFTLRLNAHNDIEMLNRYFDSDNAWYLVNFETGDQKFGSYGGRNFVHPNVANFVHPVVWLVSGLVGLFDHQSKTDLAREVSLTISPALAGVRSGLLFLALTVAGFGLTDSLLVTALGTVAFSSVLFGCLPESFVISSAAFAAFFFVTARTARDGVLRSLPWILVGTLLSSITVTNLVAFALGLTCLLTLLFGSFVRAAKRCLYISAASLLVTIVCFFVLTAAHGTFKGVGRKIGQLEEVRFSPLSLLVDFPKTLARTIVASPPNQLTGSDEEHKSAKIQVVRFTYRDDLESIKRGVDTIVSYQRFDNQQVLTWLTVALLAGGILISSRVLVEGTRVVQTVFLVSLVQLLFHWILHSFFGLELFLYSQHWIIPLVIAVGSGLTLTGHRRWASRCIVLTLIGWAVWRSASVMQTLIEL